MQPPAPIARRNHPGAPVPGIVPVASMSSSTSSSTQTQAVASRVRPADLTGVPDAALLLESGYPGFQFVIVDPSNQYQKYLIVEVQAPSGTDPLNPPNFNATLTEGGRVLEIVIPVSSVFSDANLLVHCYATLMNESRDYENHRQTRLGGIGPAIAQVNTYLNAQSWSTVWRLPLSEPCEAIIGNYSISNFPTRANRLGQKFYPVIVEFKLKTVEQSVKHEAKINIGVWKEDDSDSDSDDELFRSYLSPPKSKRTCFTNPNFCNKSI